MIFRALFLLKPIPILTFDKLIKFIRQEANLTQQELAGLLEVSTILIAMIENKSKEPSKKFVYKLAEKLDVHPSTIMPFITFEEETNAENYSGLEKKLLQLGEDLQKKLIRKRARNLVKSK